MSEPKFRSSNNILVTKGLFLETSYTDTKNVLYVLSDKDNEERGLPSIYRLYLEMEDVTEFNFANTYFSGMPHWKKICECPWFKPYLESMRNDLRLKLKAKAIEGIMEEAMNPQSKARFSALKYLADSGFVERKQVSKKRVGRPEKEELPLDPQVKSDFDSAYERIIQMKELN